MDACASAGDVEGDELLSVSAILSRSSKMVGEIDMDVAPVIPFVIVVALAPYSGTINSAACRHSKTRSFSSTVTGANNVREKM